MTAILSQCTVHGYPAIALENERVRAVVIPELGARVWELTDRARGRQWIWHRPGMPPRAVPVGSAYDDVWAGGWEELFPNDAAGPFEGRDLPDHGEWWARAWTVEHESQNGSAVLRLAMQTSVIGAACEKEFRLDAGAARLSVRYRIRSLEKQPFHFLFKQHLPIALAPDCKLLLPGGTAQTVDPSFGTMAGRIESFDWPHATAETDMRNVPSPDERAREFLYVRDLPGHWCGVDDVRANASLRMNFDVERLPFVWLFLTYGGWRDLHTAVLEPCTNMPKDLAGAVAAGQSARLAPGEVFETGVAVELGEVS